MRTRTKSSAGMTLIEVVIASIILVIVLGITFSILFTSTDIVNKSSRAGGLQARGREVLEFGRTQFYTGRFRDPQNFLSLGLYDGNTQLRYQVPINRDNTGAMQYGYSAKLGTNDPGSFGKMCILRFEADTALMESSGCPVPAQIVSTVTNPPNAPLPLPALQPLVMVVLNADANKNGNKNDSFVRGKIKKYVITVANTIESTETLDDYVILGWNAGKFNGPVDPMAGKAVNPNDSDGVYRQDWLFRYVDATGNTVTGAFPGTTGIGIITTLWHGDWDELHKGFLMWRDRDTVRFRNTQ